jgi:hypothetical protein
MIRVNPPAALLFLLFALAVVFPATLRADDCKRDFRRAEDCLRTPGFAQGIGTAVATAVTVLVNGNALPPLLIPPKDGDPADSEGEDDPEDPTDGGDDGEDNKKKRNYTLDIRTDGERTTLGVDGIDSLWVYAQITCDDPEVDAAALTDGIAFDVDGPFADWISFDDPTNRDGYKAIEVYAYPPTDDDELGDGDNIATIEISANVEDSPVGGSVNLSLTDDPFELDVEFVDEGLPEDDDEGGADGPTGGSGPS